MNPKITKFSKISNTIFFASLIFCLFFLWCNFYTKNINISFISGIIVFVAFLIIYIPINIHKTNKKNTLTKNQNEFEYFKLQIQFSKLEEIINLLKDYLHIEKCDYLTLNHYHINNQFDLIILNSPQHNISQFYTTFSNRKSNNIIILSIEPFEIPISIERTNISFIDLKDLYNEYKKYKNQYCLPNIKIKKKPKYSIKELLRIVLCKEKSKRYFFIGFLLLFTSLFTPYSTYYIIFSSILFIMSLISRFDFSFEFKKIKK